jgi:hypothetical protein
VETVNFTGYRLIRRTLNDGTNFDDRLNLYEGHILALEAKFISEIFCLFVRIFLIFLYLNRITASQNYFSEKLV